MSEPNRYTGKTEGSVLGSPHWEHPKGEWVKYEDYEKLKAQIKRMAMDSIHDLNHIGGLQEENARLKEEVERLKAEKDQAECDYDNCQKRKVSIDNHRFDLFTENKTLKTEVERLNEELNYKKAISVRIGIEAAKEGKPSV